MMISYSDYFDESLIVAPIYVATPLNVTPTHNCRRCMSQSAIADISRKVDYR